MEVLPDFYFVCSGRHGNRHSQKTVLILFDSRPLTRRYGKGKPIPRAPLPEGTRISENALENYRPRYVAFTPDDRCYWINDEWPSRYWWRKWSTPHAQLICPRCGLTKRLSVAQAAQILERYKDKGTFDIQKVP